MLPKKYKITGSIIPAIAGLDRFSTPMDVFMRLTGLIDPKEQTWPMTLGIEQEGLIARWAAKQTGLDFIEYPSTPHPTFEWAAGSPDRVVLADGIVTHGLECKFRGERLLAEYGDSGTDGVLESDMAQSCFYMGIFPQVKEWYVAVQFSNRERRLFIIQRDEELIDQFYEIGREFLENHLIPEIPPAIDGSSSSRRYLAWKYPEDREPVLEPTDAEILADVDRYRETKEELKHLESVVAMYEHRLKLIIGDCAGIKGDFGKIIWTKNKDSQKVDWEAAFKEIAQEHEPGIVEGILSNHITIKPGARVFRPYFAKED
jgi:predicted phage-related endonuclease